MARATSSLPVPLSPVISTGISEGATMAIRLKTCCIAGLAPKSSPGSEGSRRGFRGRRLHLRLRDRAADGFRRLLQIEGLGEILEVAVAEARGPRYPSCHGRS